MTDRLWVNWSGEGGAEEELKPKTQVEQTGTHCSKGLCAFVALDS